MNCRHMEDYRLIGYIDQALSVDQMSDVDDHVNQCLNCREEVKRLRDLLHTVGSLPREIEPTHDLWPEIRDQVLPPDPSSLPPSENKDKWGMHLTPEAPRSSIRALEDHSRTLGEFQERFAFRFQIQPLPSPELRGAQ